MEVWMVMACGDGVWRWKVSYLLCEGGIEEVTCLGVDDSLGFAGAA